MKPSALSFFLFVMLAFACTEAEVASGDLPQGYMTLEEMTPIVSEMELLQSVVSNKLIKGEEPNDSIGRYYQQIFEKFEVKKAVFDSSFVWHTATGERSEALYESVVKNLDQRNE